MCKHWGKCEILFLNLVLINNVSHRCPLPVFLNWRLSAPNNEEEYTPENQLQPWRVKPYYVLLLTSSSFQLIEVKLWIWYTWMKLASDSTTNLQSSAVTEKTITELAEQSAFLQVHSGTSVKSKKVSFISCEWLVTIYHNIYNWLEHFSVLLFAYPFFLCFWIHLIILPVIIL